MTDSNGGQNCDMSNDQNILAINSPQGSVGGPHRVVYKDSDERWAIVALDWDGEHRLGIRWFTGSMGNPQSSGNPTWFVLPPQLSRALLSGLPIDMQKASEIEQFLRGVTTVEW